MSADLHIHVITEAFTEEDFRTFFSSQDGSKWSPMTDFWRRQEAGELEDKVIWNREWNKVWKEIHELQRKETGKWRDSFSKFASESPNIWIGEVSWLKAGLTGDKEAYIPNPVATISELIGEDWPVLDDELIEKILAAFDLENTTNCRLAEVKEVAEFLQEHKGSEVFTISW